ncbi:tRNA-queuosine alpha-mannosyltransferase domain-containing protein [Marinobacter sp. F4206]|uniref:tRNA-queuosine alpha-mannosyltransferase domain-containing protein n=1 Tax=Marinobacter sp. F4206 TaxID=2861777 RepID=UPI001C5EB69B|nr:DUF3524 domain-containing protein [Marinobacter sp. F4206]MBW4936082.1 DUF3524 domain-containing protein [Marinobacter sp. F4206]
MPDANKSPKPRILLLSAYDAGSHRRWREQLVASQSAFEWQTLALPPRYFRWRIRGNALTWLNEPLLQQRWDLLLATSMVDLASIKGFHPNLANTPALLYMHENQFAYPESEGQHASVDPQMVNLFSATAATGVLFNSAWNRRSFLDGVERLYQRLPDGVPERSLEQLADKSRVLPVPIEDRLFVRRAEPLDSRCPHILWNHRWEYDKGPERLLLLLDELVMRGQDFRLSVVGEQFRQQPAVFDDILERHGERIVYWGFMADRDEYDRLLATANIVVSTAIHDFQGLSMLEAMASGCVALAPDRLAYPEYMPQNQLYPSVIGNASEEAKGAAECLVALLNQGAEPYPPVQWSLGNLAGAYENMLITTVEKHRLS